jgi:hypothetical protein
MLLELDSEENKDLHCLLHHFDYTPHSSQFIVLSMVTCACTSGAGDMLLGACDEVTEKKVYQ